MKKPIILLITLMIISVGILSGCTSKGADVKIISVDIDQSEEMKQNLDVNPDGTIEFPYITYDVTVNLKNVGDEGIKTRIDLEVQYWNEYTSEWQTGFTYNTDSDTVYIDVGDAATVTMSVSDWTLLSDESNRIYIEAYQYEDDSYWDKTDSYEKLL
jgi:hypothetical protein